MDLMKKRKKGEVKELFSKNWMTHDAMWYGSCMQALGPNRANQLNKGAVRLMAGIEIKRILKLMGRPRGYALNDFGDLTEIIKTAFHLVQTSFMKFDSLFPKKICSGDNSILALPMKVSRSLGLLESMIAALSKGSKVGWMR